MLGITRKRIYILLAAFVVFFLYAVIEWQEFSEKKLSPVEFTFEVKQGSSIREILYQLGKINVKSKPFIFEIIARVTGAEKSIHAGEYLITTTTTNRDLLRMMVNGEVIMRKFTIVEGWNTKTLFDEVNKNNYLKNDLSALKKEEIIKKLTPNQKHLEGLFFPETYEFAKNTTVSTILIEAHKVMQGYLEKEWSARTLRLPYKTAYEALVAASLIEKETAIADERGKISAVIVGRLKKRMYLQIDPTVIYGLGENYNGKLLRSDLKKDTPYNTYTRKGLPPTPIALPSLASIHAALHPVASDVLYFVATGDGGHVFSANLKDHLAAVAKLRKTKAEVK